VNNWKVIFATVVIFGAGVLTGGLLVNYVKHSNKSARDKSANTVSTHLAATNQSVRPAEANKPRLPDTLNKQFLQKLDEVLVLEAAQRESIRKIISESQNRIRKEMQDTHVQIREVLTSDQRLQFDELVKRQIRKPAPGTNTLVTGTNGL